MPSALSWFRKNQKLFLGVFGVGLMFVFTISIGSGVDPIIDRLSGRTSGGPTNETVVKWDGGQLNTDQMGRLRTQRNLLRRFMGLVLQTARDRGGIQRVSMLPLYSGDQSLLELEMLAGEAEKIGIEVNDETVLSYLNQLTDGTISAGEYPQLLVSSCGNNLPENALFPLLAREIKAQKVRGLIQSGNFPASPVAAWDYYNRLNRLVTAEIMPISVDDYMSEVGQPTETEVVQLFEKYKDAYAHPLSPDPGFRHRERRAFQYVKVSYDAILEQEKANVTDEEVQSYYNENKEQFRTQSADDLSLELGPANGGDTLATEPANDASLNDPTATPTDTDDAAVDEAAPVDEARPTDSESPAVPESPADSGASANSTDTGSSNASETVDETPETATEPSPPSPTPSPTALPQDEETQDEETQDEDPAEDTVDSPRSDESDTDATEQATSVGEADDEDEDEGEGETDDVPDTDEQAANDADEAVDDGAGANAAVEAEEEAEFKDEPVVGSVESESEKTADAAPVNEAEAAAAPADDAPADDAPAADEQLDISDLDDVATYRELPEVSDEIRQTIAAPRAQAKAKSLLDSVQREMEKYFQDYTIWEIDSETNSELAPPTLPDFGSIADGKQAVFGQVELTDQIDIENYEIGQAFDVAIYQQTNVQRVTFASVAYTRSTSKFRPQVFPKLEMLPERFVYWLTDTEEEYVPELEQVRDKVVEAWQRQQALELAKQEAASLVSKAKQANTTLRECLADDKYTTFVDTGEISWVTAPMQEGAAPQITPIIGAEDAGPELRKELFRLPAGGVSFAANMPRTKVYVFRVAEEATDPKTLREQFLQNGVGPTVMSLARRDSLVSLSNWYTDLTDRYNVDWQRDPRQGDGGEL